MTNGTHVVVVLDQRGQWADVLGPFLTRTDAVTFRRRLVRQTQTRRRYFGLDPAAVVVSPLLSATAYEQARADIAATASDQTPTAGAGADNRSAA
jgi:hypothetical protein